MDIDQNFNIDSLHLHKMLFVYNAILNGWIVKKLSENKFEFKKNNKDRYKKEFMMDNFLETFVNNNLNTDLILTEMKQYLIK